MGILDSLSSFTSSLSGNISADLAIDLGTANTLVAISGQGIVVDEPSVVAIERGTSRVLAVGNEITEFVRKLAESQK